MSDLKERARRERIRVLLRTRNDYLPTVRAKATPYTISGPAPSRKRNCPACDGIGKTRLRQKCEACDGKGKIALDGYVGRVASSDDRKPEPMSPERREAELAKLKAELAIDDPEESYGWERARSSRDKQGSYLELERALEWLRERDPLGWEWLLFVYNYPRPMSYNAEVREQELVGRLSERMPEKIRLPRYLHDDLVKRKLERAKVLLKEGVDVESAARAVLLPSRIVQSLI